MPYQTKLGIIGIANQIQKGLAAIEPPDADVAAVAAAIVKVVDMPFGKRPFRIHIDPAQDALEGSSQRYSRSYAGRVFASDRP